MADAVNVATHYNGAISPFDAAGDVAEPGASPCPRRTYDRAHYSQAALAVLEAAFKQQPIPSLETRKQLGGQLNVTRRQIQIWFQNRRQRERKRRLDANPILSSVSQSSLDLASSIAARAILVGAGESDWRREKWEWSEPTEGENLAAAATPPPLSNFNAAGGFIWSMPPQPPPPSHFNADVGSRANKAPRQEAAHRWDMRTLTETEETAAGAAAAETAHATGGARGFAAVAADTARADAEIAAEKARAAAEVMALMGEVWRGHGDEKMQREKLPSTLEPAARAPRTCPSSTGPTKHVELGHARRRHASSGGA
mmetsp:Transcript_37683/g.88135  ORF Transcript_37683/g.88135 Transcript_37683/m.88135 type:complete len:313 (-) Transcript_37683:461-1399(-)